MKFEISSFVFLLAIAVSSCQQVVPQFYGALEVPSQGDDCPTAGDTEAARNTIRDDTQNILQENIVPTLGCGLGECQANPADSCDAIYQWNPSSVTGNYWLKPCDGNLVQAYCSMGNPCGCSAGGWRRIAYLDMSDDSMQCPHGLDLLASPVRTCERRQSEYGYVSAFYSANNIPYSEVCGRILAYQVGSPDAFSAGSDTSITIDDPYLDGVMLTYGHSPRKHIWSFAAGVDNRAANAANCPCSRSDLTYNGRIPPFVGDDWFCETGFDGQWSRTFVENNPLWDGQGCAAQSTCCTQNNPPWFCKTLPTNTSDFIELRFHGNQNFNDENIPVRLYEIYVK